MEPAIQLGSIAIVALTLLASSAAASVVCWTQWQNYRSGKKIRWSFLSVVLCQASVSVFEVVWWSNSSFHAESSEESTDSMVFGLSFTIRGIVSALSFNSAAIILINWLRASRSLAISRLSASGFGGIGEPGQAEWLGMVVPVAAATALSPALGIFVGGSQARLEWAEGVMVASRLVPAALAVYLPIRYGWPVTRRLHRAKSEELRRAASRMDVLGWFFIAAGSICIPFYAAIVATSVATYPQLYVSWLLVETAVFSAFTWTVALVLVLPKFVPGCSCLCCYAVGRALAEDLERASESNTGTVEGSGSLRHPASLHTSVTTMDAVLAEEGEEEVQGGLSRAAASRTGPTKTDDTLAVAEHTVSPAASSDRQAAGRAVISGVGRPSSASGSAAWGQNARPSEAWEGAGRLGSYIVGLDGTSSAGGSLEELPAGARSAHKLFMSRMDSYASAQGPSNAGQEREILPGPVNWTGAREEERKEGVGSADAAVPRDGKRSGQHSETGGRGDSVLGNGGSCK